MNLNIMRSIALVNWRFHSFEMPLFQLIYAKSKIKSRFITRAVCTCRTDHYFILYINIQVPVLSTSQGGYSSREASSQSRAGSGIGSSSFAM